MARLLLCSLLAGGTWYLICLLLRDAIPEDLPAWVDGPKYLFVPMGLGVWCAALWRVLRFRWDVESVLGATALASFWIVLIAFELWLLGAVVAWLVAMPLVLPLACLGAAATGAVCGRLVGTAGRAARRGRQRRRGGRRPSDLPWSGSHRRGGARR